MIKFFRSIRKKLISENSSVITNTNYIKYAIGEIFLVVIGILIALSINNWNINKVKEREAYNQLLEVQNEILHNILEFDDKGNYYFEKLRDIRRVLSDTLVIEDYQQNKNLSIIMSSYYYVETQNEAFNKLIENADNLPDRYKPLILEIKKLYNLSGFEMSFKELINLSNQHFVDTKDFSESRYRNDFDDYHHFLFTNKGYRNSLARFSFTLDDVAPALVRKKYAAIELYKQMIAMGFPDKDLSKIEKMYIDINPKIAQPFIGRYTNTKDTLIISYLNKDLVIVEKESNDNLKLIIRDTSTLCVLGAYLEFNKDKSMFYLLMLDQNPHYKRIPENK